MQSKLFSFSLILLTTVAAVAVTAAEVETKKVEPVAQTETVVSEKEVTPALRTEPVLVQEKDRKRRPNMKKDISANQKDDSKKVEAPLLKEVKAETTSKELSSTNEDTKSELGVKSENKVSAEKEVKPETVKGEDKGLSDKDVKSETEAKPNDKSSFPALKLGAISKGLNDPLDAAQKTKDEIQAENKRRMEEELRNTTTAGKNIVNFPNRSSLGALELAPLPTINESAITGPAPMDQSVSAKDLPSEQLLGRITPEVFQEMADLERGNTFLKLQLEKERLKNDLENLKSTYREKRLSEIEKREKVVRTRIQWWQEQEKLRLEVEKKQKEAEELDKKLAEEEANRERLREEAMERMKKPQVELEKAPVKVVVVEEKKSEEKTGEKPVVEVQEKLPEPIENLYTIDSIRGVGKNLTAKLKNKSDNSIVIVKVDDILPSGYVIREIKSDMILVAFGDRMDQLIFRPAIK